MNRRTFLAAVPAAFLLPRLRAEEKSKLVGVLQPNIDADNLPGAVTLVTNKDKVLDIGTIGYSDVEAKTPMKADAMFWIASMSKPITAAALMILVDEGSVKLDDPIAKYLPEMNQLMVAVEKDGEHMLLKKPMKPPTVRQCLSHTSGMVFVSFLEQPKIDALPLAMSVKSYAITPLQTEPGTKWSYSNAGINVAGRIIEVVSKMPYETFLDKRLFGPCGMTDTTFWPSEEQMKRMAKSYKPGAGGKGMIETEVTALKYPLTERSNRFPCPGGGLFATAADCGKFCRMLLCGGIVDGKKIISPEAIAELGKKQTGDALKETYGLGFGTGPGWFGHGGAFNTDMTIDTKNGLAYIFMVQRAGLPTDGGREAFKKAAAAKYGMK